MENKAESWVNRPLIFGATPRGIYWGGFHVVGGILVAYGAYKYGNDPKMVAAAILWCAASIGLGLVEWFRISPDVTAMVAGFLLIGFIGGSVGFDRIQALKGAASTVGSTISDGYEATTQAAGFGRTGYTAPQQAQPQPQRAQPQPQQSNDRFTQLKRQHPKTHDYVLQHAVKSGLYPRTRFQQSNWTWCQQGNNATGSTGAKLNCSTGFIWKK